MRRPGGRTATIALVCVGLIAGLLQGATPATVNAAESGDGLLGTYYPNQTWSGEPYLTRVDPTIDFPGGPTPPPGRSTDFSVVWSGLLFVETAGTYTFGLNSDDGSSLILNGTTVINNGGLHPPRLAVNTVDLAAGLNSVSLMYFQAGGGAVMTFLWTPPDGTDLVVVPQGVLFSNSDGSLSGPPARLGFAAQPSGGKAGQTLTTQPVVRVQDANFQTVPTSAATVTISVSPGTGTAGAVLTCTGGLTEAAVSGVATFSGCAIDQPGWGYSLVATSPGLVSATGSSFDVIANGDGLLGTYYPNETWSVESSAITVDPVIDFNWGVYPYSNPPASFDPDGDWSIEWTGNLLVTSPGTYSFCLRSDDGSVLSLDGSVAVNNGGAHAVGTQCGSVELAAGFHFVLLRYFECCRGEALVQLFWTRPGGVSEIVPQSVLFSNATSATGTLHSAVAAGATSLTVDVTSACPFAATGGLTWQLRFSTPLTTEIANIQAASAITAGQQTLQTSALPYAHPAGDTVTQVVADCGPLPDTTPPVVTGVPDRDHNAAGWYKADVTIHWNVTDPAPSSGTPTQPPDTVADIEDKDHVYTSAPSCDPAGNCRRGTFMVSLDETPPTITLNTPITAETGDTFVVGASDELSCVRSARFAVGDLSPAVYPYELLVPGGADRCLATLTLTGKAPFAPGEYTIHFLVEDSAGNPARASGTLRVVPTKRVVILVQGLASEGLDETVDCGGGLPTSTLPAIELPVGTDVLGRAVSLVEAFQRIAPDGGVPLDDLTLYVLDYPLEAPLGEPIGANYCYTADPDFPFEGVLVPRYDKFATTLGINENTPVFKHLDDLVRELTNSSASVQIDLVGHSQGGALIAYWLSRTTEAKRHQIHSVVTLDAPWGGINDSAQLALCSGATEVPNCLEDGDALRWQSWTDLMPGRGDDKVTNAIKKPIKTTLMKPVVSLTCDEFCLPFGGVHATREGAWLVPVMQADIFGLDPCRVPVGFPGLDNHGCFFLHEPSLNIVARVVGSDLVDDRQSSLFTESKGWAMIEHDELVMRSGLSGTKVNRPTTFPISVERSSSAALVYFTGRSTIGLLDAVVVDCSIAATVVIDPGTNEERTVVVRGMAADAFHGTENDLNIVPDHRRRLCRAELGHVDAGEHELVITITAKPAGYFVLDAIELGPIAHAG